MSDQTYIDMAKAIKWPLPLEKCEMADARDGQRRLTCYFDASALTQAPRDDDGEKRDFLIYIEIDGGPLTVERFEAALAYVTHVHASDGAWPPYKGEAA